MQIDIYMKQHRQHRTDIMQHRTKFVTNNLQHANTDKMQWTELQHATCKTNELQRCKMELQPATCNMRHAERTTQHCDNKEHATAT